METLWKRKCLPGVTEVDCQSGRAGAETYGPCCRSFVSFTLHKSPLCSCALNVHYQLEGHDILWATSSHLVPFEKYHIYVLQDHPVTEPKHSQAGCLDETLLIQTITMETNRQWPDKANEWHLLLPQEPWQNKVSPQPHCNLLPSCSWRRLSHLFFPWLTFFCTCISWPKNRQ